MKIEAVLIVSLFSGLYTSCWGAFKDIPYEGFKARTFLRSVYLSIAIAFILYFVSHFGIRIIPIKLSQIFFLIMGIERLCTEIYKGFFRNEDQSKYFIPSRITFFGKPIANDTIRYSLGVVSIFCALGFLSLETRIITCYQFLLVSCCAGLAGGFGGAYKDGPFEGFKPQGFFRTPIICVLTSPLIFLLGSESLGFLIFIYLGIERFIVEYYKTYIQRTMSGKFKPDLQRNNEDIIGREKFHYIAIFIILGLILLIIHDIWRL